MCCWLLALVRHNTRHHKLDRPLSFLPYNSWCRRSLDDSENTCRRRSDNLEGGVCKIAHWLCPRRKDAEWRRTAPCLAPHLGLPMQVQRSMRKLGLVNGEASWRPPE